MDLDRRAVDRLMEVLEEGLGNVAVQSNAFLVYSTVAGWRALDQVLPGNRPLRDLLTSYVSDEPFSDFAIGRLSDLLINRDVDSASPVKRLAEIDGFEELASVARALVNEFISLPWEYTLFSEVPGDLAKPLRDAMTDREFTFCPELRLVQLDGNEQEFSRTSDRRGNLLRIQTEDLREEALYLSGRLHGYVPHFGVSRPLTKFQIDIRAFVGFLLAFNIARPRASTYLGHKKRRIYVYRHSGKGAVAQEPHEFPDDAADAIRSLGVTRPFGKLPDPPRSDILRGELKHVRTAFEDPANQYLVNAAQWLFDSYSGSNQLLSFIQAAISLEIVFGEKSVSDLIGLGELLGNRCAYLIGSTRQQRQQILRDFKRIYETRSRIVHRGHSILTAQEASDLGTLRWMCGRAIKRELELVAAERGE